jgi:hypothetical protein
MSDPIGLSDVTAEVGRKLDDWRKARPGRSRSCIPDELWNAAAELASRHGVHKTSRALHLNHSDLKRRVEILASGKGDKSVPGLVRRKSVQTLSLQNGPVSPTFMELVTPFPSAIGECTMEVESMRGARMRIEMKQVAPAAIAAIIREFEV